MPNHEREGSFAPQFRLRAVIMYSDNSMQTETADFSPRTDEWQFASVQFAKNVCKKVKEVDIYCDYGYNTGIVYFDDIQLVRDSIEFGVASDDFNGNNGNTDSNTSDSANKTDTAPTFTEAKDKFGNTLTETTFTDGEFGTIYRAFGFTPECNCAENAGNDLVSETDARGNKTTYKVHEDTSRNEEIIDRLENKTAYEYDVSGKTTKVTSKDANGTAIANVSYNYDAFDNMTEIVRGDGMKYALAYNQFHNLESIGVVGKTKSLIKYTYKNGNGRLKAMTYANGHTMKAIYNSIGQMVAEKWFETEAQASDSTSTPIAHYKYVYDGQGNIVQSIDFMAEKCYNYEYEEGRLIRSTESDVEFTGEIVTSKTVVNTVRYYYGSEDKLERKVIIPVSDSAQTIYYETTDDNTTVKFSAGGRTVTSHSKTDSFGRKEFDELQIGTGFVSRQFHYHVGEVTEEHRNNAKLKSSATTQLVSQIILSNGTTISYGYDAEERITSVVETCEIDGVPVTNTTLYTYDALGQLLTETVNGNVVNTMTYDNYGNIKTKNGISYTYGDENWKDLLTSYNGQSITYDDQGNPISYLGHTLTWEKGRQLKSFDGNTYTYNANGIRTSKTVDGIRHEYILDGVKIIKETWNGNTIIPLYDNEDTVCGINYNNTPYYFLKNLQGDVIAIVDKNAETVARYSYDAWGVPTITQDTSGCQIATINPFRYRGYYFDECTGLYYLQSRYYDANVGRFVNADVVFMIAVQDDIIVNNLFTYCNNNPIMNTDNNGKISVFVTMAIGALFGLAVQWIIDMITNLIKGNTRFYKPCSYAWDYICSAASGALAATGIGRMAAMFASAIIGTINYVLNCASNKAKSCRLELIMSFVIGLICGYIGGSGANLKNVNGIVKTSKTILKTAVSSRKIAMYTSKIKNAIVSTVVNAIRYIVSAVANSLGSAGKKYVRGLLGC